jgi:hypothetical protein
MPQGNENYRPKYPESPFYHICDFVDKETGKTSREMNAELQHKIPIGALVEDETGVRLFVVHHNRDCDMTPLYCLGADPEDTKQEREGFANHKWITGYPEYCLKVIRLPGEQDSNPKLQGGGRG